MSIKESYNKWSVQYDSNENKTRDLEGKILKQILKDHPGGKVLEIGCGTGKNTAWLVKKFTEITAVDFSEQMLAIAKNKITDTNVEFVQADINMPWIFTHKKYDLITFSLVLEHIENLNTVFEASANALKNSGIMYLGELHPIKQYSGSKARFETSDGTETLTCYTHHVSDFIDAAKRNNLQLKKLGEHFDEDDKNGLPRILTLLFEKSIA